MSDDDLDRNLDTIRRRLVDMEAAMANALSDDPTPTTLPVTSTPQSYEELTEFNDKLRDANHWTGVDLDAALTPELAAKLEEWRSRQRIPWSNADIAAVGLAGMVGGTCVWFDSGIDRLIRQWLNPINETRLMQAFEKAGKQLPIDYMGPGFGGNAHRVKSAGHDLARPFTALRQIMDGQFEGVAWSFGQRQSVIKQFVPVQSFEEALLRWVMHLCADVLTPMSLPIPGFSLLYESNSQTISKFAHHAYAGIRPGEGLNLRSALIAPGMTAIATETVVRTHIHLSALRERGSTQLTGQEARKRNELRLAAHSLVGAASIGKAVAQGIVFEYGVHPAQIRHVNMPALIMAGKAALQVAGDFSAESRASAPSWDELLLDLAQPWQLDLACAVEVTWSAQS
jgi:hypothetical protein